MISDEELLRGFEAASLTQFHHAEHVRVTILYLVRHGREEALRRLTVGIRGMAAAGGQPEKFHATMTRAWLELIDAARTAHPDAAGAAALVAACPELLDRDRLRRYYSSELLQSDRARREWLPPDLQPISTGHEDAPGPAANPTHNVPMPGADPIPVFLDALNRAASHQIDTAPVALATADGRGRPSARMVLLRGADARGFVFFTNFLSRKGRELTENPFAAICIHWPALEEQIRIEGAVEHLPDDEADEYFSGRPRGSQIGAWASEQSQVLPSRETLEERYREVERRFDGAARRTPPFLGRVPAGAGSRGILVRPCGSPPRARGLPEGRRGLAHRAPLSLSGAAVC